MLAARFAIRSSSLLFNSSAKSVNVGRFTIRELQSQAKPTLRRAMRGKFESSEGLGSSISTTPITLGQGLVAGASVIGLGSLAYYGLGFSNQAGILDKSSQWPQMVRDRIKTTYQYVGASLGATALSAMAILRSPTLMNLAMRNTIGASLIMLGLAIGSGMVVRSIPYEEGRFGTKQLAWATHAAILGAMVAPLACLGGAAVLRAAWYTAGIVGGLSLIAATAPSEKFLNMTGPLAIGLGVVFASSIGTMFLPPTTRLGLSLYSVALYGGLVLFSMFLLYDTQKIVKHAETHMHFDPVNESISIYLDILNIFIRMATILAGGGSRRK